MASVVDWESLCNDGAGSDGKGGGKGKTKYLKFESGKMYTIRPIGNMYRFAKFFIQQTQKSVIVNHKDADAAAALLSEAFGTEIKPSFRYVTNIIDREDNSIKIMEGGKQIFAQFALWGKGNKTHPGGQQGGDWLISVSGEKLLRKYNAQCIRPSPLSEAELKRLKSGGEVYDLQKLYADTPLNEVVSKARAKNGEPDESGADVPSDSFAQQPAATTSNGPDLW